MMKMMRFLTDTELNGLKEYAYKPSGYTWLDDLHQPLWNWIVQHLPFWLAPNLITLIGLCCVMCTYWLIFFFQPNFLGTSPCWVLILSGLSIIVYANLDCIDGKQARRTGTSSPLGQLFDHGCDAYIVHLLVGSMIACLELPCGWRVSVCSFSIMCPWMLAQLEEYHTGIMLYGNGIWGVIETLYSAAIIHFITATCGVEIWQINVLEFLPISLNLTLMDFCMMIVTLTAICHAIEQIWRTLTFDGSNMPAKERGNKELGFQHASLHLIVICLLLFGGLLWLWMADPNHCRLVFTSYGTIYALIGTQLIIAHMAKTCFSPFSWSLALFIIASLNSVFSIINPLALSFFTCILYNLSYFYYCVANVQQICTFLDVWCLSIKKQNVR